MLDDDAEREREDIPAERHRQNIVDLFGYGTGGYQSPQDTTQHARGTAQNPQSPPGQGIDTDTPETKPGASGGQRRPSGPNRDSAAWDTLRAHQDDARLPEALRERIGAALSPLAPANESEAQQLAGALLDWLNNAETEA